METRSKGGPKPIYDWPRVQNGRWQRFRYTRRTKPRHGLFRCSPKSFVSLLHRRKDTDGLRLETVTRENEVLFIFWGNGIERLEQEAPA